MTKLDIIKEQDAVRKDLNDKVIDDVAKFKTTGHVSTITLSNEGVSKVNNMFGEKIIRNEKEDTPNVIDSETIRKSNNNPDNKIIDNTDKETYSPNEKNII